MNTRNKLKCLNALDLKAMAMVFMLCDHMWATVVGGGLWLTGIGRLAFPIFAFEITEGFVHTHSYKKYMLRMLVFALLSEIPFNLMLVGGVIFPFDQNVMFTFLEALLFLKLLAWGKKKGTAAYLLTILGAGVGGYLVGTITMVDYGGAGVLTVLLFYICRDLKYGWILELAGMIYIHGFMIMGQAVPLELFGHTFYPSFQLLAVLALIPIWMYNGKSGPRNKAIQYIGYGFYPVHMLLLHSIRSILVG